MMNQQTGNDRYAGTTPPRENQQPQSTPQADLMTQAKQAGSQMDNQSVPSDTQQRREQAGQQSDQGLTDGGKTHADGDEASDAPEPSQRGYGGATKEREDKLDADD